MKNIFLTGAPSSGKTTVIKKIIGMLPYPKSGFYTEEERVEGRRVGFILHSLDGKMGYLAHQNIVSPYRVRRYGVDIHNIETIAVPAIKPIANHIIIMDEIGKMECFSEIFKQAALRALDSDNIVVGTITLGGDDFILQIKQRNDIHITEVTLQNRDTLPVQIVEKINKLILC
ncbi:MAG: nucleoside-triphosphatase [Spirochaetes bacterium]|nr:nucleoside-triphosphatase [Spirochaetota bacterium]